MWVFQNILMFGIKEEKKSHMTDFVTFLPNVLMLLRQRLQSLSICHSKGLSSEGLSPEGLGTLHF